MALLMFWLSSEPAEARQPQYAALRRAIAIERLQAKARFARLLRGEARGQSWQQVEQLLVRRIDQLFPFWLGSRWGLGRPQSTEPHLGKTNCGLFVAVVLRDAGFNLPIWKFNRQASSDAIRSLAPRRTTRYFNNVPVKDFVAGVRKMGPGLFLIGLDFHIGFLRQDRRGLRFIHGSYLSETIVDEPAEQALPIVDSRYRVVGKLLEPRMLRSWLTGRRIRVLGNR